jgi:hypothetical protein
MGPNVSQYHVRACQANQISEDVSTYKNIYETHRLYSRIKSTGLGRVPKK